MHTLSLTRDQFIVKDPSFGFDAKDHGELSLDVKIILIHSLYEYLKDLETIYVEDTNSIDEVLFILAKHLEKYFNNYSIVLTEAGVLIADYIEQYDIGVIPLYAFIKQRKNKEFFNFLIRLLKRMRKSYYVLDNYGHLMHCEYIQENYDYMDSEEEVDLEYKHAYKILTKFIEPMNKLIEQCKSDKITKKEIAYFSKEYPTWAAFIKDAIDGCKSGKIPIGSFNLDCYNLREDGYICFEDAYSFSYDHLENKNAFDLNTERMSYASGYSQLYVELIYVYVSLDKKKSIPEHERELKKLRKRAIKRYKIYNNEYECFQY